MADRFQAAREIVSASNSELCLDLKFLTRAVMTLDIQVADNGGRLTCDGRTMTFDREKVISMFREDPNLVTHAMAHMALHCILGHHKKSPDPAYGLAEDMIVEYILDSLDTPHVSTAGRDDRLYACEKYFKKAGAPAPELMYPILKDLSQWQMDSYLRLFTVDDHSCRGEEPDPSWEEMSKQALVEVEAFSKNLEGRADGLMRILRIRNRRRYDYRAFLRRFMSSRSTVRESMDEFDYIYYSYGLRMYGNLPLLDSLEYSDTPRVEEFVIAVDTSGSTMKGPVMKFLEETYSVMRQSNLSPGATLHIIQCDDQVRSDYVVRSEQDMHLLMSNFELKGGGNTDFRPVFRYVDQLIADKELRNLKGLMYFTDGLGTYPVKRPPYDTAFVFCDDRYRDHPTPPWAIKIMIQTGDLME